MWHHGDGGCYWWGSPGGRCAKKAARALCEIEISPVPAPVLFLSLFTFFASRAIIKSSPETRKKDSSSGELAAESSLLSSSPSSKSQLPQWCVIEIFIVGNVRLMEGVARRLSGWRIMALAFYVRALPSRTCFIRESPRTLCDRNTCLLRVLAPMKMGLSAPC